MKKSHLKKLIAPIVISAITLIYLIGYLFLFVFTPGMPFLIKLLFGLPAIGLIGVVIFVFIERLEEIRSGEEDDISKY